MAHHLWIGRKEHINIILILNGVRKKILNGVNHRNTLTSIKY